MKTTRGTLAALGLGLLVCGVFAGAALQVTEVAQACDFAWAAPNNPTLNADSSGNFGGSGGAKELETSVVLFSGESTFTLKLAYTSGTSTNIANCTVSPSTFLNAGNDNGTSVHQSDVSGQLTSSVLNGTVKISAWNQEHPEQCSEEHSRTVNHG